ncbi:hypothetical protein [Streptomyces niveus]|uniref:hypothetical protein n=1 Tax=Streptomyces niveus TaxID=193462 RepID=UPI003684B4FC
MKASRWGQIENGYLMKDGTPMPTKAGDMQLAHMANVTGVRPDQLDAAGRQDAADILREIQQQEAERQQSHGPVTDPRVEMAERILNELPPRVREEVLRRFGGSLPAPSDPPQSQGRGREAG